MYAPVGDPSLEELEAIAVCAADLGIRKIKVTGGEPLVRRDCPQLVRMLKNVPGIEKVTLTTNGVLLEQYLGVAFECGAGCGQYQSGYSEQRLLSEDHKKRSFK